MAKVRPVVYKLGLFADNRRRDAFHVLLLKEYEGSKPAVVRELPIYHPYVTEKSYQLLILFSALESTAGTGAFRALSWISSRRYHLGTG